jgi:hypothetical protein
MEVCVIDYQSEKNICFTSIRVWLGIPQKFKFVLFKINFFIYFQVV